MVANLRTVDLVVVGASFAGLVCARTADLRGLSTLVIEAKSDPGARIHTTGILVKEASEEIDIPRHFTRTIPAVRLYAPSLHHVDLEAPGYYFLTSDTAALIRWLADEARRAGAEIACGRKLQALEAEGNGFRLPEFGVVTRFLVGADGARSTVAERLGLGRNRHFLAGLEWEFETLPGADDGRLHCFLDSRAAPGYLAWIAPAPGFFQVGLAGNGRSRPDLRAFMARTRHLFAYDEGRIRERRSGLIPCGGPVAPSAAPNALLIGDAAGHVSPLTGGCIRLAFRYGRRAGQLIADYLDRGGPPPAQILAGEISGFAVKRLMRVAMDLGPPDWLFNFLIGTAPMNWLARRIYFHRRGQSPSGGSDRRNAP